jgi:hypothetical protein
VDDVHAAHADVKRDNTATKRRTFIRTTTSGIEAITHLGKTAASKYVGPLTRISPAEWAVLREESYSLSESGKAIASQRFPHIPENFRFTVETLRRLSGDNEYSLDVGGRDWRRFKNAIRTRNRIVHPRSVAEYDASATEIQDAALALKWAFHDAQCHEHAFQKERNTLALSIKYRLLRFASHRRARARRFVAS